MDERLGFGERVGEVGVVVVVVVSSVSSSSSSLFSEVVDPSSRELVPEFIDVEGEDVLSDNTLD